jgi:murein DD-endopeptidase MepM/ murein hydrolase activator NlpD
MSPVSGFPRLRFCAQALAITLIGIGAAGCSAQPDRFDGNGFDGRYETGSIQPGQRFASAAFRPPMPIPEAPLTVAVAAPKAGARNPDPSNGASPPTRSNTHPVAAGMAPIKVAKRDSGPSVAEGTKAIKIASPEKPRNVQVALRSPNATNVATKKVPMVVQQPPARPAQGPVEPVPAPDGSASVSPSNPPEAEPAFNWPVRGQLLAGFGAKINGQQNHGINVAVPEDTSIKAAESGVVVYAGNQLKSYGNLLLVRHPNGYVTVYANAKQLLVKSGDEIKRGQVIAKSGRTGDVDTPQVHFEIRKASAPVDPMPYLNGA